MSDRIPLRRALLGVYDKAGIEELAAGLAAAGVELVSTGATARRIADVKARLQRTNPVEQALDYNRMFGELVMLEQHRRRLQEGSVGQGSSQS